MSRERGYGRPPLAAEALPDGSQRALGRVRALLAKAESTTFPEEAEALTAKAQQLISRYSLERLLDEAAAANGTSVTTRDFSLAPPYVTPKGMVVAAVAAANRCDCVLSPDLGLAVVIGAPADLDAVELLARSLLVQAECSLDVAGRHVVAGRTRTASFRRAFLLAYAQRISERLRAADEAATDHLAAGGVLLPVLARHDARVTAARETLFPHTRTLRPSISNGQGWASGRAAADVARMSGLGELGRNG